MIEYKPLCVFKQTQQRRRTGGTNTHSEDLFWLPTCSHVGVVDLLEDHPRFVVLAHLTGGADRVNSLDQHRSQLLGDSLTRTCTIEYAVHKNTPFDFSGMENDNGESFYFKG